jgi:hypothetical protein
MQPLFVSRPLEQDLMVASHEFFRLAHQTGDLLVFGNDRGHACGPRVLLDRHGRINREQYDGDVGQQSSQQGRGFQTIQSRHGQVEHDKIGLENRRLFYRLIPIANFAANLKTRGFKNAA